MSKRNVCRYCGKVGARVIVALGMAHFRCLKEWEPDAYKRRIKEQREQRKPRGVRPGK